MARFGWLKNLSRYRRVSPKYTKVFLSYLVFVAISAMFWVFITLNNVVQRDLTVPLKIVEVPDSTTIITNVPRSINVSVKDKGVALLKFMIGDIPTMNVKFKDYADGNGTFYLPSSDLRRLVRNMFENSTNVLSMSLDNLTLKYTNLPGKKVPIRLDLDIQPNIQYIIYGQINLNEDSVMVYSDRNTLAQIDEVYTYHVEERELTDTLTRSVALAPIPGAKLIPNRVVLTIPVEPLIMKKQNIPVTVKNVPENINVVTFPSVVEASFLVPFSEYKKIAQMTAVADYRDIIYNQSSKLCIRVEEMPALYENLSLAQDSVEYIIERQ